MNDHIPDVTKMISDTPRMQSALLDVPDAGFANIWKVGCEIERELNAAQQRIKRLEKAGDAMEYSTVVLESSEDLIEKLLIAQRVWRKAKEAKP
jgi:hypothetical protein